MYYHASPTPGITVLEPRRSNHGVPLVYFSTKRENVLVYLSNAVEKVCRETGFPHSGPWTKWGPYGFRDGVLLLEEYYPSALEDTYRGVSGYIYRAAALPKTPREIGIPDAAASSLPVPVNGAEFVPDALEAILSAERAGLLALTRYGELTEKRRTWIRDTVRAEYAAAGAHPEYRHFLRRKFPFAADQ